MPIFTPSEKAAIMVESARKMIETTPSKFTELLEILSDHVCTKEVVGSLHSTFQGELTSLVCDHRRIIVIAVANVPVPGSEIYALENQ